MKLLKTYSSTLILLGSVIAGGIAGAVIGPKAALVQPLGDLFLNLIFTMIIPLIFFSISSSIGKMTSMKRLWKIMLGVIVVFTATALISAVIGVAGALIVHPSKGVDPHTLQKVISAAADGAQKSEQPGFLQLIVNTFTVSDFVMLLSRKNVLQLIVFSIIFGLSTIIAGEKADPFLKFLESGMEITRCMIKIIMYFAPIGLGCYFASVIGQLGSQILQGYLRTFALYMAISVVYYFGFFTLYAFIAGGKAGIRCFWDNVTAPSITALATCSSAACIPVNMEYVKKIGVVDDITETVLPLGANIHKDGSVIGGVMKITFLLGLYGRDITSFKSILAIIFVSYLVGAVMGAIPGGGMIGEMLIISVYGFPPQVLPMIAVISTIIDAPATLLNSTGNMACAMLIQRLVEGKNWITDNILALDKENI